MHLDAPTSSSTTPGINFSTAYKLEALVVAIERWYRQCQSGCNLISATSTAVNTALSSIVAASSGQAVSTLSGALLSAVSHEVDKLSAALEEASTALTHCPSPRVCPAQMHQGHAE